MRPRDRLWLGSILMLWLGAALGCDELRDLFALQSALAREYEGAHVNVNVSAGRRSMELRLAPSAAEGRPPVEVAREAARFARLAYPHPVDRWIVVFGSEKKKGPLRLEWKVGRYEFESGEL
jgi:hypothetical protein